MLRERLRYGAIAVAAVLALTACTDGGEPSEVIDLADLPATEEQTEPPMDDTEESDGLDSTEEATEEAGADDPDQRTEQADDEGEAADGDPYAIPEDGIDEAYVERVLNAIFEVNREALALTLESEVGGLAPFEAEERLRSIYGGTYGATAYVSLNEIASTSEARERFRSPPGPVQVEVLEVVSADPTCIKALHNLDFSAVVVDAPPMSREYAALAAKPDDIDRQGLNPTPWIVVAASNASAEALSCDS